MKVAIATFGDRVSPRFDCAASFLVMIVDQGEISERRQINASDWAPHERINRLIALGVNVVVCGGIDRWSTESLESVGVTLYGRVAGTIEDVVVSLIRGDLTSGSAPAAGECRGGMGWRRGLKDDNEYHLPSEGVTIRGRGRGRHGGQRCGDVAPPRS